MVTVKLKKKCEKNLNDCIVTLKIGPEVGRQKEENEVVKRFPSKKR